MRQRTSPLPAQLALDLKREATELPTCQDATGLLQVLADLLLGALGEQVEGPGNTKHGQGGADEPEDHA